MAKKRKLDSKLAETTQTQQQQEEEHVEEVQHEEYEDQECVEEDEEVEAEEEEEYEKEEEEEEEGGNGANDAANNRTEKTSSIASAAAAAWDRNEEEDDEPLQKLRDPFSKEQLVDLLRDAADEHTDVADRMCKVADEDPAHRKIFLHCLGWDTNSETLINAFMQYGEIEDCKAVCDKISGKSKGYGFVLFRSRSRARKALKQPQKKTAAA